MDKISARLSPFPVSEELYLFKVVRQKHKIDAAESQLSDNEEEVHDAPAERVRQMQSQSGLEASPEMNICAAVLDFPSQGATRGQGVPVPLVQIHRGASVLSTSPPWLLPLCMSSGHHQSIPGPCLLLPTHQTQFFLAEATESPWHERLGSRPFSNSYSCDPRPDLVAGQLVEAL